MLFYITASWNSLYTEICYCALHLNSIAATVQISWMFSNFSDKYLSTVLVESVLYINICLSTSLESKTHAVNFVSPELFHYKNISTKNSVINNVRPNNDSCFHWLFLLEDDSVRIKTCRRQIWNYDSPERSMLHRITS